MNLLLDSEQINRLESTNIKRELSEYVCVFQVNQSSRVSMFSLHSLLFVTIREEKERE